MAAYRDLARNSGLSAASNKAAVATRLNEFSYGDGGNLFLPSIERAAASSAAMFATACSSKLKRLATLKLSSQLRATTPVSSMMHPTRVQSCLISSMSSWFIHDTKPPPWAQVQIQLCGGWNKRPCAHRREAEVYVSAHQFHIPLDLLATPSIGRRTESRP